MLERFTLPCSCVHYTRGVNGVSRTVRSFRESDAVHGGRLDRPAGGGLGGGRRGRGDPGADRQAVPRLLPLDAEIDRAEGGDRRDRPQAPPGRAPAPDPGRNGPGPPGGRRGQTRCHPARTPRGARRCGWPGDRLADDQAVEPHAKNKAVRAPEPLDPEVVAPRQEGCEGMGAVAPDRFVFRAQSPAQTTRTRRSGRAPRGERVGDHGPAGKSHATTMLGAWRHDGTIAARVSEGGTDVSVMRAFAAGDLRRILRPRDLVVMDNLSAPKDAGVIAASEAAG